MHNVQNIGALCSFQIVTEFSKFGKHCRKKTSESTQIHKYIKLIMKDPTTIQVSQSRDMGVTKV